MKCTRPLKDSLDPTSRALSYGGVRHNDDLEKRRCRWCGGAISNKRRTTFCSQACVEETLIRTRPGYARRLVEKRDRGVCCECGLDTARIVRIVDSLSRIAYSTSWVAPDGSPGSHMFEMRGHREVPHPSAARRLEQLNIALAILSLWAGFDLRKWCGTFRRGTVLWGIKRSLWEADHIKPVVEGGGQCGLDNYRTLCLRCHKGATAKLATKRAKARKSEEEPAA